MLFKHQLQLQRVPLRGGCAEAGSRGTSPTPRCCPQLCRCPHGGQEQRLSGDVPSRLCASPESGGSGRGLSPAWHSVLHPAETGVCCVQPCEAPCVPRGCWGQALGCGVSRKAEPGQRREHSSSPELPSILPSKHVARVLGLPARTAGLQAPPWRGNGPAWHRGAGLGRECLCCRRDPSRSVGTQWAASVCEAETSRLVSVMAAVWIKGSPGKRYSWDFLN